MTTETITQWESLNDVFSCGKLEVWYMKHDHFRKGICGDKPKPGFLDRTHIKLGSIAPCPNGTYHTDDLEEIWRKLQGEFWSPNGEARNLIESLGLEHTSMSVGDCFRFPNGDIWIVAGTGFKQIKQR